MTSSVNHNWKAGQKVFEPSSRPHWGGSPGRPLTIDRVTASGRAVIGSQQYDPNGWPRGSRHSSVIVPFTEEHQAAIDLWDRRQEVGRLADKIKWWTLDAAQLDIALPALQALTTKEPAK